MKRLLLVLMVVMLLTVMVTNAAMAALGPVGATFYIGQTEKAGYVAIWEEVVEEGVSSILHVQYRMKLGYCLDETHVHVGDNIADIPQNSGGAIPGQFDYQQTHDPCQTSVEYEIPINYADFTDGTEEPFPNEGLDAILAIHGVVGDETGWTVRCGNLEGAQFPGSDWSAYVWFPLGVHTIAPN
ncbi:MAG: hypothetical protein ACOCXI_02575 [Chloroflexota bacterium]